MEWLETDGLGGFAMGSASSIPMRRYHALLVTTQGNPANRISLVNTVETCLKYNNKKYPLSSFLFDNELIHPQGIANLKSFSCNPFPCWIYNCDGVEVLHEVFMIKDIPGVFLSWKVDTKMPTAFEIKPFLSGRFYHALHKKNNDFNFRTLRENNALIWKTYPSVPEIYSYSNGTFTENNLWFENINYTDDRMRGCDYTEDWASPGIFSISEKHALLVFSSGKIDFKKKFFKEFLNIRKSELKRRLKFKSVLSCSAESYLVKRGSGKTIIAGYPWFADWGRDTFISMRGICISDKRLDSAKEILTEWSKTIKDGLIPNRFTEAGTEPEYNSVDAALWYVIACYEYIQKDRKSAKYFAAVISSIVENLNNGTYYNIGLDHCDGLLKAGIKGQQLTWMDAKSGGYVITPRIGKPVEIQALWLNVLHINYLLNKSGKNIFDQGLKSFSEKFWNQEQNCLYDVVDSNHQQGNNETAIRPNQIFAVGGLPLQLIEKDKAEAIVKCLLEKLYTPFGLRTLAPEESSYRGHYSGDSYQRDTAYHQGTVWPWLMGAFIEAWVRVNGNNKKAKKEAYNRFYLKFIANINNAGLGHLSEIHDADLPHTSRGCPFQAWSVGEALRMQYYLK